MHILVASFLLYGVSMACSISVTAFDMPECAVDCYIDAGVKIPLPPFEYKLKCLSAPFQLELRSCALEKCSDEEYSVVFSINVALI
jgi:hypothetical protein